jgi:hypothetical protein
VTVGGTCTLAKTLSERRQRETGESWLTVVSFGWGVNNNAVGCLVGWNEDAIGLEWDGWWLGGNGDKSRG